MRKLILSNFQSPGDLVTLTASVRDLHRSYCATWTAGARSWRLARSSAATIIAGNRSDGWWTSAMAE